MSEFALELDRVSVGYGDGVVLADFSMSLARGESLAVLGRNGVGKTTLMLAIAGHLRPLSGSLRLLGRDVTRAPSHLRTRMGLGWVPQGRDVFAPLTVEENLRIAAAKGPWTMRRVYDLFPRLEERRRNFGDQLSGGEQQMLAIGRALVGNPQLLLLDEPLEGLAPVVAADVARCILQVVEQEGMAAILVEQDVAFALRSTRRAVLIERGAIALQGESGAMAADRDALERYVGVRKSRPPRA